MLCAEGLADDPLGALARVLGHVLRAQAHAGEREPLRFTAALTDGERIYALRYASDAFPPSMYYCDKGDRLLVVSEPLDSRDGDWTEVGPSQLLSVDAEGVRLRPFAPA